MKTTKSFKRFFETLLLGIFIVTNINPIPAVIAVNKNKIVYPLKEISKLECRFKKFSELGSNCKEKLPILKTKDYQKYSEQNGGYNKYTRIYTELWGASYEYGWDVGNGGHIGTDIATSKGTPVYSIAEGTVTIAENIVALGNSITIQHRINGKTIYSNYSHLSKINVRKGDKVKVGEKIGEVGSTGNSTGNHLHFQIDFDTPFHPYYYEYDSCPFSYYKITETGVCFNELKNNTIDPLLFLETGGKILDNIKFTKVNIKKKKKSVSNANNNSQNSNNLSIFTKTVHYGYPRSDIKKVQKIYKDLGQYNGPISGNFEDIEESIISYQISKGVIKTKNDEGAGWFGPKTRSVTKADYTKFLAKGTKNDVAKKIVVGNIDTKSENNIKVQKISRKNLLSREQIEAKEIDNFIKYNNIDLKLKDIGGNIENGKKTSLKIEITDRKGRLFKGSIPSDITFIVDTNKVNVFPQKFYYFKDGKRDITLTGLKNGNTTLYIKMGKKTIKSFPLKVYSSGQTFYPNSGITLASKKIVLGDSKTAIVLFKDKSGRKLINLKYGSTFKIDTSEGVEVCIKKGSIKKISSIFKSKCSDSNYKNNVEFSYEDTVGGLLIFDYKATGKNAKINIINKYNNKNLSTKSFAVTNPKGLKSNYAYKNEVLTMLEQGVVDGINRGYFLENRELSKKDALKWISNSLEKIQENAIDPSTNKMINEKLYKLSNLKSKTNTNKSITRQELLDLSFNYLVFNESSSITRNYIDLDKTEEKKISNLFDNKNTWKDKFGEKYYRPDIKVTRGEGAFLLANAIEKNRKKFLTLK